MDMFSIRSVVAWVQKQYQNLASKSTDDASKSRRDIGRSHPSCSSRPTLPEQEPYSSSPSPGKRSPGQEKRFEAWTAFLARHDNLAQTRVESSDVRRELLRQRDNQLSSLKQLSEQLSVYVAGQENFSLSNTKTEINEVLESIQDLQATEEKLIAIEKDIVQREFQVEQLLPRLFGREENKMTLKMLENYGFDIPGEKSDLDNSDSRDLDKETTGYENEPVVQAYLQKLNKINELEDRLMTLRLERRRAQDEREEERELNGEINEVEEFEVLDGHEQEHEELVKSLRQARAELEELRGDSEGPDDQDGVKEPSTISRLSSTDLHNHDTTTIVTTQSQA